MNIISLISRGYFCECRASIVFGKGPQVLNAEPEKTAPVIGAVDKVHPNITGSVGTKSDTDISPVILNTTSKDNKAPDIDDIRTITPKIVTTEDND